MTRLILVRHGQSLANAQRRFAGHSDFDLSELGRKQAELVGKYLFETEKPNKIYSSDLSRAYNTALPASKLFGLPINATEGLREIYAGSWEGLEVSEIIEKYGADFGVWKNDFSKSRCTDGESVAEVYERIVPYICSLAEENDGKTLLLATHATVVRAFTCFSAGLDASHIAEIPFCNNASVNIFTYENKKSTIVKTNIDEFLGELASTVPPSIRA